MKILALYAAMLAATVVLFGPVQRLAQDSDAPFLTIAAAQSRGQTLTPSQVLALTSGYSTTIANDRAALAHAAKNDPWSTP